VGQHALLSVRGHGTCFGVPPAVARRLSLSPGWKGFSPAAGSDATGGVLGAGDLTPGVARAALGGGDGLGTSLRESSRLSQWRCPSQAAGGTTDRARRLGVGTGRAQTGSCAYKRVGVSPSAQHGDGAAQEHGAREQHGTRRLLLGRELDVRLVPGPRCGAQHSAAAAEVRFEHLR
jgi:hypothetical protein